MTPTPITPVPPVPDAYIFARIHSFPHRIAQVLVMVNVATDTGRPEVRVFAYSPETLMLVSTAQSWPSTERGWLAAREEFNRLSDDEAVDEIVTRILEKAAAARR